MTVSPGSPITQPSNNNVLQNFSDATAGRSLQLYNGVAAIQTAGNEKRILTRDSGVSNPLKWEQLVIEGNTDFDITINKPTILSGIGYLDLHYQGVIDNGTSRTHYVRIKLIHYDGTTETTISSADTSKTSTSGDSTEKLYLEVTKKLFSVGHILRLNIEVELSVYPNAAHGVRIHHDPLTAGNELNLWVPVVNLE